MSESRKDRIERIFLEASERPTAERAAFVDDACAGDPEILAEVCSLLEHADGTAQISSLIEGQARELMASLERPRLQSGQRVGPYCIEGPLGRGGMGEVYLARRADGAFEKRVAIKVHRQGPLRDVDLDRFLRERQILANLDHPGIARLIDGDTLDDGTPYLVMDYVEGQTIDEFCKGRQLTLRRRIKLFLQVCEAVAAAHRALVIHRDLKPSNILVTDEGAPRVLDFGVATLLDDGSGDENRPLTLQYASPEQLGGSRSTQPTDVWALGVVLYEMLAGSRPFPEPTSTPEERARYISRTAAPPPSAQPRKTFAPSAFRGDLDAILLRALQRNPDDRYRSVDALAEDLRRYLERRPVEARSGGPMYRLGRYLQRHAAAVTIAGVSLAAIASLVGVYTLQVQQERDFALEQAEAANQVADFMVSVFQANRPDSEDGSEVTARELLDRAVAEIQQDTVTDPPLRARLMRVMGSSYRTLAMIDEAEQLTAEAVALMESEAVTDHPQYLGALNDMAVILAYKDEPEEAERLYRQVIDTYEAGDYGDHPSLALSWSNLGHMLMRRGDHDGAGELFVAAMEMYARLYGTEHRRYLTNLTALGRIHRQKGNLDQCEATLREAREIALRVYGEDSPKALDALNELASLASERGEFAQAAAYHAEHVPLVEQLYAEGHNARLIAYNNFASALDDVGRLEESAATYAKAVATAEMGAGPEHRLTVTTRSNLAQLQMRIGQADAAIDTFEWVYELRKRKHGADHIATALALHNLTYAYVTAGRLLDAAPRFQPSLDSWATAVGKQHAIYGKALTSYGSAAWDLHDLDAAMAALDEAIDLFTKAYDPGHPEIIGNRLTKTRVLAESGHHEQARTLLDSLAPQIEAMEDRRDSSRGRAAITRGYLAIEADDPAAAIEHLRAALTHLRADANPRHVSIYEAAGLLCKAQFRDGRIDAARASCAEAIELGDAHNLPNCIVHGRNHVIQAHLLAGPDPAAAASALDKAEAIFRQAFPPTHPDFTALAQARRLNGS